MPYEITGPAVLDQLAVAKGVGVSASEGPTVLTADQVLNAKTYKPEMLVENVVRIQG